MRVHLAERDEYIPSDSPRFLTPTCPLLKCAERSISKRLHRSGTESMHKCMKCPNPATLHITEVMGQGKFEELHFCENCAQKYMQDPSPAPQGKPEAAVEAAEAIFGNAECPHCSIKFVDFPNSGRLGGAHDYEIFRDELLPLLENIHGDPRHCG